MINNKPSILSICATSGRHQLLERLVACFIAQDYEGEHTLLIFNNSDVSLELGDMGIIPGNKHIELVNNHKDSRTKEDYDNLGAIYMDALLEISSDVEVITHGDDDDLYLPDHFTEGAKGYLKAKEIVNYIDNEPVGNKCAYKPQFSWFRHALGIEKMSNNLEPSIFIEASYLKSKGYKLTTTDQHYGWYEPLLTENKLFVDKEGVPTLIYNWGDVNIPTFKTSGNAGDPNNFMNYRIFSQDHGDRVITPLSRVELDTYYAGIEVEKAYIELRT